MCKLSGVAPKKSGGSRREGDESGERGVLYLRAEPGLIAALDKEAQSISEAAGGLYVSRNNAALVVLRKALAHQMPAGESVAVKPKRGANR